MKHIILFLLSIFIFGCSGVSVKTHHGFMGPNTYEATDGKISVYYYNGDCCCVAEKVLRSIADRSNRGEIDWMLMSNQMFRDSVLSRTCDSLRKQSGTY